MAVQDLIPRAVLERSSFRYIQGGGLLTGPRELVHSW